MLSCNIVTNQALLQGLKMSKVLRISVNTFEKLEANATGFESPSEVIDRAINSNEEIEVIKLVARAVVSAEEFIEKTGLRKKTVLLHQPENIIEQAMSFITEIFPQYIINHTFEQPGLNLVIKSR